MYAAQLLHPESKDISPHFRNEFSAMTTSLFKDNLMRKSEIGGWLLHHVRWKKNVTYKEIAEQHEIFLHRKYGRCSLVFGEYEGPSTKDHELPRRAVTKSADITVLHNSMSHRNQDALPSNPKYKTQFIKLLMDVLNSNAHEADADTLIISTAMEIARGSQYVPDVAEDTDIFIMRIHHWKREMSDSLMMKERKSKTKGKSLKLYSMSDVHNVIDPIPLNNILFVHALSGCDTTPSTFG